MSSPLQGVNLDAKVESGDLEQGGMGLKEEGGLAGRTVKKMFPTKEATMRTNPGEVICLSFCFIGTVILIAGVVMFGLANQSCDNEGRDCNNVLKDAGVGIMITGSVVVCCGCLAAVHR